MKRSQVARQLQHKQQNRGSGPHAGTLTLEALEFIAILATFAVVLAWYIKNAAAGDDGARGLLALSQDPETAKPDAPRASYRIKTRLAMRAHERRDAQDGRTPPELAPAFRALGEADRMRRKFRLQDEARYRAKDKAARYTPRSGPGAS